MLPQFRQGGVGLLLEQLAETLAGVFIQGGRMTTAMRLGSHVPRVAVTLDEASDEGQADAEAAGNLSPGAFVGLDGSEDAYSEVQRVGSHNALLSETQAPPLLL